MFIYHKFLGRECDRTVAGNGFIGGLETPLLFLLFPRPVFDSTKHIVLLVFIVVPFVLLNGIIRHAVNAKSTASYSSVNNQPSHFHYHLEIFKSTVSNVFCVIHFSVSSRLMFILTNFTNVML